MTAKAKANQENILVAELPTNFNLVGLDSSLNRPGFCNMTFEGGCLTWFDTWVVDNKTKERSSKCHGEKLQNILDEGLTEMDNFDNEYEVFYLREHCFISQRGQSESGIFKAVGLEDWQLWTSWEKIWLEAYPSSIKSELTGNYKADKKEMERWVRAYLQNVPNLKFKYDDESDAAAVCIYFLLKNNVIEKGVPIRCSLKM